MAGGDALHGEDPSGTAGRADEGVDDALAGNYMNPGGGQLIDEAEKGAEVLVSRMPLLSTAGLSACCRETERVKVPGLEGGMRFGAGEGHGEGRATPRRRVTKVRSPQRASCYDTLPAPDIAEVIRQVRKEEGWDELPPSSASSRGDGGGKGRGCSITDQSQGDPGNAKPYFATVPILQCHRLRNSPTNSILTCVGRPSAVSAASNCFGRSRGQRNTATHKGLRL